MLDKQAKPVLPVVNFQAFEGAQTIIRLDKARRVGVHAPTAGHGSPHAPSDWCQWLHLQHEPQPAEGSRGSYRNEARRCRQGSWFGLQRFPWTSSKEGIWSSHSSRVAVGRRVDRVRIQFPNRIDHRMIVGIENVFSNSSGRQYESALRDRGTCSHRSKGSKL